MTCMTALFLSNKYSININETNVKVSRKASEIPGTTANLNFADTLTVN